LLFFFLPCPRPSARRRRRSPPAFVPEKEEKESGDPRRTPNPRPSVNRTSRRLVAG
jgi:hypothetical protein